MKSLYAFFVMVSVFVLSNAAPVQATFIGNAKTGLFELEDVKHPVYLFVPEQYQAERDYPLIVAIPGIGKSPEDFIKQWTGLAKSTSMIVMVPSIQPREGESPYRLDEWVLSMKNDVMNRYRIAKQKIFLLGEGTGASYSAYLAASHPEEFSAAALLNGSWFGPYSNMIHPEKRPRKQIPFFVAFKNAEAKLSAQTEKYALRLQKKGYPVYMEKLGENEEFSTKDFQKRMFAWLQEKSESWQGVIKESEKKVREKFSQSVERNIKST